MNPSLLRFLPLVTGAVVVPTLLAWFTAWGLTTAGSPSHLNWLQLQGLYLLGIAIGTWCVAMLPFKTHVVRAFVLAAYVPSLLILFSGINFSIACRNGLCP